MAKNTELIDFLTAFRLFIDEYLGDAPAPEVDEDEVEETPAKTKAPSRSKKKADPEPEPEPEDEDEDEADEDEADEAAERRAELEGMTLKALQRIAIKAGFAKDDVADADKETLVDTILEDEGFESPEDGDADEDADADEDEADEDDRREELEGLGLNALKKIAREEYGMTAADYKGMDKDGIIDLILDSDLPEGEEEDEDEDEDMEDDLDEDYTEEELEGMSLKELKEIASEWEITIKAGTKKPGIIKAILDEQEAMLEDEDDDED